MHLLLPLWMVTLADPPAPRHYVNSAEIILSIENDSAASAPARAWISRDDGNDWRLAEAVRIGDSNLAVRVPSDGRYSFFLSQPSESDRLGEVPPAGRPPQVFITVDTAAPTLQIRSIAISASGRTRSARLELTLIDENLGPQALQVFYRPAGESAAAWLSGGFANRDGSDWTWLVPAELAGDVDIRLLATDLAGNRSSDQRGPVRLPDAAPSASNHETRRNLINAPISLDEIAGATGDPSIAPPSASRAANFTRENSLPVGHATDSSVVGGTAHSPGDSPSLGTNSRTRGLRDAALAHLERGRPRLALARIDDALELSPEDVKLRSLRGLALLRAGDRAAARTELLAALAASPDETDALAGMVRLSMQDGDHEVSRATLEKLTRLQPDEPRHWLDLGDVLFKSGQATQAQAAWTTARDRANPADRLHARAIERLTRLVAPPVPASRPTR